MARLLKNPLLMVFAVILMGGIFILGVVYATPKLEQRQSSTATAQTLATNIAARPTAIAGTAVSLETAAINAQATARVREESYAQTGRLQYESDLKNCVRSIQTLHSYDLGTQWITVTKPTTWSSGYASREIIMPVGTELVVFTGMLQIYPDHCPDNLMKRHWGTTIEDLVRDGVIDVR